MDAAVRAMGLTTFDENIFNKIVSTIIAPENGVLLFSMRDGREIRMEWQNISRRESWTPEMREKARINALQHLTGGTTL